MSHFRLLRFLTIFTTWSRLQWCTTIYISPSIYTHRRFFEKFCNEILNLNENPKEIYIPLYILFGNLENFVKCTIIYIGIYGGAPLYDINIRIINVLAPQAKILENNYGFCHFRREI